VLCRFGRSHHELNGAGAESKAAQQRRTPRHGESSGGEQDASVNDATLSLPPNDWSFLEPGAWVLVL